MGFWADIVQNGKKYMVLIDAEELWACVARTVTQGWDVPDDVLLRSFKTAGEHACQEPARTGCSRTGWSATPITVIKYRGSSAHKRVPAQRRMPSVPRRRRALQRLGCDVG